MFLKGHSSWLVKFNVLIQLPGMNAYAMFVGVKKTGQHLQTLQFH